MMVSTASVVVSVWSPAEVQVEVVRVLEVAVCVGVVMGVVVMMVMVVVEAVDGVG